jgi:hypothetical protein
MKQLGIILATTLFASLLWVSVNLGEPYQVVLHTPLHITGVPEDLALRGVAPPELRVKIRGAGWSLAPLVFGRSPVCAVDISSLPAGTRSLSLADVVDRLPLPAGVTAVEMSPQEVALDLEAAARRLLPLRPRVTATFRERYGQVGPIRLSPESVLVRGAASVVERLEFWNTAPLTFELLRGPVDLTVPVAEPQRHRLEVTPRETRLRMDVQWFAEKTLADLPVEVTDVPPHRDIVFVPPRVDLVVRGGVQQLSRLGRADVRLRVEYAALLSDTTGLVVPLVMSPPEIQVVARRPERLQYIIRKRM